MAFLAPVAAELGGYSMRKLLPWLLLGAVGLCLGSAIWVQTARLEASRKTVGALQQRLDAADADAARWQAATGQRDDIIRDQAAQLTRLRADVAAAARMADATEADQRQRVTDLIQQIAQWKARAHAHPDQTRQLGPIVLDALGSLRQQTGPASAAAAGH
jgi:small-conductance mechanosensitive channel